MDWATKRQLQYFTIIFFAVIVPVAIFFFVFVYQAPTCFDGVQNGKESGIDCGGACRLLCTAEIAEPISRWDPRVFKVGASSYSVLAYLENPNVAAEVFYAPYSFKLYDAQGTLITERLGKTYIPKGGNFAIFEPNIDTGQRVPTRATFQFSGPLTWIRNTDISPSIVVTNQALMSASTTPRIEATVKNNSLVRVPNIDLTAVVSDGAGNAIGASRTFISALNAGETQNVTFTWPTPFVTKAEVCASPVDVLLLLDRSGSMAALGSNPPQPLTDVKTAGVYFINQLDKNDTAGLVSFATSVSTTTETNLTSDFTALISAIDALSIHTDGLQQTNISGALAQSLTEFQSARHRSGVMEVAVLLTDGVATEPSKPGDPTFPERSALTEGAKIKADGARLFTIGLGKDVNAGFLKTLASNPEDFYSAPTAEQLKSIYSQIATKICTKKPASIEILPRLYPYNIAF